MNLSQIHHKIETHGGLYFATHAGKRYIDDICGVAMLEKLGGTVIRIDREERTTLDPRYILFSVGAGRYDHHQSEKTFRSCGVPYSAFGLLFNDYGHAFLETFVDANDSNFDEVLDRFEKEFVQCVDAHANSYPIGTHEFRWIVPAIAILDKIDSELDHAYVLSIMEGVIHELLERIRIERQIEDALEDAGGGLLILDPGCSFIQKVRNYNITVKGIDDPIYLVVHPNETNWTLRCMPDPFNDNTYKLMLPNIWLNAPPSGCHNDKLTFCHKGLWMATFETKQHAEHAARALLEKHHPKRIARQSMANA